MFDLISAIIGAWPLLIGLTLVGLIALSFLVPGLWRRLAGPMIGLGTVLLAHLSGKRRQRAEYDKKVQKIIKEREEAYDKIDSRNTDTDDVLGRLRDGRY